MKRIIVTLPACPNCASPELTAQRTAAGGALRHYLCNGCGERFLAIIANPRPRTPAATAKERQQEHGGTAPGKTLCQKSDKVIQPLDTKKELAAIAGGRSNKNPTKKSAEGLETREELAGDSIIISKR